MAQQQSNPLELIQPHDQVVRVFAHVVGKVWEEPDQY
jgi:hypothetical protein